MLRFVARKTSKQVVFHLWSWVLGLANGISAAAAFDWFLMVLKANILRSKPEQIFETFKRDSDGVFIRLDAHLNRLKSACRLKAWPFPETDIQAALDTIRAQYAGRALHIRLALTQRDRGISVDIDHKIYHEKSLPLSIALSRYALDPKWQETRFKTAHRQFYDGERARIQALYRDTQNQNLSKTLNSEIKNMDIDEVIFADNHGLICEGSYTAIFLKQDGKLYTPTPSDNILPSIFTAHMIKTAQAQPRPISMEDLKNADEIYCGNSLRGLMPAVLASKDRL